MASSSRLSDSATVLRANKPEQAPSGAAGAGASLLLNRSRSMRALVVGLVGAVLLSVVAHAGECRSGQVVIEEQPNESTEGPARSFRVTDLSSVEGRGTSQNGSRTLLRGTVEDRPFILDAVFAPHMASSFDSYPGTQAAKGLPTRWGASFALIQWIDEKPVFVSSGPLAGVWTAHCQDGSS